jgi:hypothetical protein
MTIYASTTLHKIRKSILILSVGNEIILHATVTQTNTGIKIDDDSNEAAYRMNFKDTTALGRMAGYKDILVKKATKFQLHPNDF